MGAVNRQIPYEQEYYRLLRYGPDGRGGYRLEPNQRLEHITINELGFRGEPFRGEERLLVLGDSVTFGVGASGDEACFGRYLEAVCQQPVADASVRAYRIGQHLKQLPGLLSRLPQLQQVVLWGGYADLLYWAIYRRRLTGAFRLSAPGDSPWSRCRDWAIRGWEAVVSPRVGVEKLAEEVLRSIRSIARKLSPRRISLWILIQPFIHEANPTGPWEALISEYNRKARRRCGMDWTEASRRYLRVLKEGLCRQREFRWLDCQPLVDEEDFLDPVHLREEAVRRLVEELVRLHGVGVLETGSEEGGFSWVGR